MLSALGLILLGYIMGSIPTGYWVCLAKGIDIRKIGSGSTGATNVLRAAGKTAAIFVLIADVAKGYIPVWLSITPNIAGSENWHVLPVVVGVAAMVGHSTSIFLNFKGGKSAATALGTLLAMNASAGAVTFAFWIFLVCTTRVVSVASISAGIVSPIFFYLFHSPASYVAYCGFGGFWVLIRHKANIKRLMSGTEPRIGQKPPDIPQ